MLYAQQYYEHIVSYGGFKSAKRKETRYTFTLFS